MNFAGIGAAELLFILIIALLIFGPAKLPEMARDLGKSIGQWRKALREIEEITDVTGAQQPAPPAKEEELQSAVQTVVRRTGKGDASAGDEVRVGEESSEEEAEVATECQT